MKFRVRRVERTGSTNADVLAAAAAGEPEGLVVVAGTQTAGRGRQGRTWESPPGGGLWFTVLVRPDEVPVARFGWLRCWPASHWPKRCRRRPRSKPV